MMNSVQIILGSSRAMQALFADVGQSVVRCQSRGHISKTKRDDYVTAFRSSPRPRRPYAWQATTILLAGKTVIVDQRRRLIACLVFLELAV